MQGVEGVLAVDDEVETDVVGLGITPTVGFDCRFGDHWPVGVKAMRTVRFFYAYLLIP